MSTLFDTETHHDRHDHAETEFTLSTASLLGIFFGLALVCAVFFGFGYSMGRRSTDAKSEIKSAAATVTEAANSDPAAIHPKPPASQDLQPRTLSAQDSPAGSAAPVPSTSTGAAPPVSQARPTPAQATSEPPPIRAPAKPPVVSQPPPENVSKPLAAKMSPTRSAVAEPVAVLRTPAYGALSPTSLPQTSMTETMTGTSSPPQASVVQIAAVSHQEDADVLVAALKKRGYNVAVRHEPQDQLMHVQVGPFANHADAIAMRQKLLADGYNAIVKP